MAHSVSYPISKEVPLWGNAGQTATKPKGQFGVHESQVRKLYHLSIFQERLSFSFPDGGSEVWSQC